MLASTTNRICRKFSLFALLGLCLAGCKSGAYPDADARIPMVATTSILADAVTAIGGDRVRVECLMGPGIDPHRYLPTSGDVQKLAVAKAIFHHGLHLEGKMSEILEKPRPGQRTLAVSKGIPESDLRHADEGAHDPHVWFDPLLWLICVQNVADELAIIDPEHAPEYANRAAIYIAAIRRTHEELERIAQAIPKAKRVLVTSHDAFGYFGAQYGFEVHGLQGVSTASETSTKDVVALAELLGKNRIEAVFCETSVPSKGLEAVLDSVNKKYGLKVKLIGGDDSLYSDALGEKGTTGDTYVGMIRHNMQIIARSLGHASP